MSGTDHWIVGRFTAVDAKDIDGFLDMLTDDHSFLFGGRPPVVGKADAREQVLIFWSMIGRLRHNIRHLVHAGDHVFVESIVDYERLDGCVVAVPCCDVMRVRDGKICETRAYLDQSSIWAEIMEGADSNFQWEVNAQGMG